ncbi:hypothetical protein [Actinomadura decatromicini]|uniref:Uncharacterized protein n=1 Tax=Actinomadura decatromicini TaxID=2604572 RepID=A0A5D3FU97_9ACTN|nr:hypothetical protein [Actinomadura decatromicini]TYK50685.1 hypothetical protein FXF68_09315 [Actinomadura decatromicini]
MNEAVALLLVQRLFPEWVITRDAHGNWRAAISSGDLDGLMTRLAAADPDAARRAVHLLTEGGRVSRTGRPG